MLYPLIARFLASRAGLAVSAVVTLVAICGMRYDLVPKPVELIFDYRSPLQWVFYLALGIWIAKPGVMDALESPRHRHLATAAFLVCLAGMAAIVRVSTLRGSGIDDALDMLGPSVMLYTALVVLWAWKQPWDQWRVTRVVKWFAGYAYGMYLSHVLVLALVSNLCYRLSGGTYGPVYGLSLFATVAVGSALLVLAGGRLGRVIGVG